MKNKIYSYFGKSSIVSNIKQLITTAVWSNTSGSLVNFYTSSIQSASTGDYYYDVYHENPQTSASLAEVQYAIAYGHRFGSGSTPISDSAGDEGLTPSRAIYSQYRNFLLSRTANQFTIGTANTDQILVINFNRARAPESLDPANWEVSISGSSAGHLYTFIDDSTINTSPDVGDGGTYYNIVSGSIEDGVYNSTAPVYYGLMYPQHSLLLFDSTLIGGLGVDIISASDTDANNHGTFLDAIQAAADIDTDYGFKARNEENIRSTYYFARVQNADYNFSSNPSFYTGSLGDLRHEDMLLNPQTYITTVGMYNDKNELLAVAKLSRPLRKSFNREALLRLKLDF